MQRRGLPSIMTHCGFLIQVSPTLKPCRKSEREGLEEEGYSEGLQEDIHIIVQNRSVIFIFFFFIIHRLGREWERRVGGVITLFLVVCGRSFVREKSLSHFSSGKSLFCKFASAGMPSHPLPRAKGYKFHEATVSNSDSYHSLHTPHRDGPPHTPRPSQGKWLQTPRLTEATATPMAPILSTRPPHSDGPPSGHDPYAPAHTSATTHAGPQGFRLLLFARGRDRRGHGWQSRIRSARRDGIVTVHPSVRPCTG